MRKYKKKSSVEMIPLPALLQMLIMLVKKCEHKPTKILGRAGERTWCDPNSTLGWMNRRVIIEKYFPPRGADLDGSGRVDFRDLAIFANNWLKEMR